MIRIGIILILVAGVTLFYTSRFNWQPLKVPLNLQKDNSVSATFTADMSATHFVRIDFQRTLPFDELGAVMPAISNSKADSFKGQRLARATCAVFNNNREVNYGRYTGHYWSQTAGAVVRSFPANAGQKYTVKVSIKGGASKFQNLKPSLDVVVFRDPVAFGMDNVMVLVAASSLALLLGLVMLITGALKLLNRRVRHRSA